jgi:hypothetical protein
MKKLQEQQAWTAELERGSAWLEEQRTNWQRIAEERAKKLQEQQARAAELERDKARLEEQWRFWQAEAAQQRTEASGWRESLWVRFGVWLGVLHLPSPRISGETGETTGDRSSKA